MLDEIAASLPVEFRIGEIVSEWKQCEGHIGPVYAGAFSPDGRKAISAGADGKIQVRVRYVLTYRDGKLINETWQIDPKLAGLTS